MVSKLSLFKFIEYFISVKKPPLPIKSFTNDEKAKEWLRGFI
ncbi:DUF7793 family protein [Pedobacter planticolens]